MFEFLRSLLVPVATVAIVLPFIILIEMVSPKDRYALRDRFPAAIIRVALPAFVLALSWPLNRLWAQIGVEPVVNLSGFPAWLRILTALVFVDFLRYWEHRLEHRVWWPVHSVHHSVRKLNAANAYSHPLLAIPEFFVLTIPLSFVDWGGPMLIAWVLTTFNDMFIHSPITAHYGPLRHVFVDNRFHRIHHSLEPEHFDKNFGLMFTLWDRLFGTAYFPEPEQWPAVGVDGLSPPTRMLDYAKINWPRTRSAANMGPIGSG